MAGHELTHDEQDVINRYRQLKKDTAGKRAHGKLTVELEFGKPTFVDSTVREKAISV